MLRVGDKVRINSKEWFETNKELITNGQWGVRVYPKNGPYMIFSFGMEKFCGREATIIEISESGDYKLPPLYSIDIDKENDWVWIAEMFDNKIKFHKDEKNIP